MITFKKLFRTTILLATMLAFTTPVHSQFLKKLGKAVERAAQNTVENRVERETQKKTDAALDSILEPGTKKERILKFKL
jgi:OOP family OmpA-OmpF porin